MIYKVYYCKDCNTAVKDEVVCIVCGKEQLQIGWVETNGTGENNEQEDKG
jgi:RNA polymerase subunit RPABC4/transcription elongation factor Spt4